MYAQPRPDWGGYGHHGAPPMAGGHPGVYGHNQASQAQQRSSQVSNALDITNFASSVIVARMRARVGIARLSVKQVERHLVGALSHV